MIKFVFLDAEFNQTSEPRVNPVCLCWDGEQAWHHKELGERIATKARMEALRDAGHVFVSFSVESEARYFHALGLDPREFQWICLYLEWRQLLNHNADLMYGDHLSGRVTQFSGAPDYSLAGALFRLLKVKVDTDRKAEMRKLIISNPAEFSEEHKREILEYCASDVTHLKALFAAMIKKYQTKFPKEYLDSGKLHEHMLLRGQYAARTSIMVDLGYPLDVDSTRNFSDSVSRMLHECMSDINDQFPDIVPFRWDIKKSLFIMNTKPIRQWIAQQPMADTWDLTDGGATGKKKELSLSVDVWTKFFDFKHNYPRGNFGAQMVRYFKLKQSLNGFMPRKEGAKTKSFWDSVGSDGRVRPYFGIYGAQSGRSQPSATGFIPLKAAWIRSLIQARPGRAIAGVDYSSQEFLLSALASQDEAMLKAYESGDVYLAFAKQIGIAPKDATKASHKFERDLCKSTILGLSYLMSKVGLARKLTNDTGKEHTENEAQALVDLFDATYPYLQGYREEIATRYESDRYLQLPCGWCMFGDNPNMRSVSNMPIQGWGSSIMRKAVEFAQDAGLDVIYTLHDAIYIEYDSGKYAAIDKLCEAMDRAFRFYVPDNRKARANCRLEADTWSLDYPDVDDTIKTPKGMEVLRQKVHVDGRSIDDYKRFKQYFSLSRASENDLL